MAFRRHIEEAIIDMEEQKIILNKKIQCLNTVFEKEASASLKSGKGTETLSHSRVLNDLLHERDKVCLTLHNHRHIHQVNTTKINQLFPEINKSQSK